MPSKFAIAIGGTSAALSLALAGLLVVNHPALQPDEPPAVTIGQGDYELQTPDGPFTEASLAGAPTAVFFGFTHCPDVCPTTLGDIAYWQEELAEAGHEPLRVYFVTVDPERDTLDVLEDYVSWAPGVTPVSGSTEAVDTAIEAFRIYARRVPLETGGYNMDHTSYVMLFDEDGHFFEPIGYREDPVRVRDKLTRLLNG